MKKKDKKKEGILGWVRDGREYKDEEGQEVDEK